MQRITPCLWFDDNAETAVKFSTSIFKNSKITTLEDLLQPTLEKKRKRR